MARSVITTAELVQAPEALRDLRQQQTWMQFGATQGWVAPTLGRTTPDGIDLLTNPDPILSLPEVAALGSYVYFDMRVKDGHLRGVWRKLVRGVLALPSGVHPAGDAPEQTRRRDIVRACLDDVLDWSGLVETLLDAEWVGRAAVELVWTPAPAGKPYRWALAWRDLGPDDFLFDRLARPWYAPGALTQTVTPILPGQLALSRRAATTANPFGVGDGRAAYFLYWLKREGGLKAWAFFNNKHGFPWVVGKTHVGDDVMPSDAEVTDFAANLLAMQENSVLSFDARKFDATLLEAARTGTVQTYGDFLAFINMEMSKALLGETLSSQPQVRGSSEIAELHGSVFEDAIKERADHVSQVIREQVVRWVEYFNVGPPLDGRYCSWAIDASPPEDLAALTNRMAAAQKMGAPIGERQVYAALKLPPRDPDDTVLVPAAGPVAAFAAPEAGLSRVERAHARARRTLERAAERAVAPEIAAIRVALMRDVDPAGKA